jgi:hypothetical protein
MDDWFSQIEETILTQLDYMLAQRQDAPFPNLVCTSANQNQVTAFPTMYVHELEPVETGNDLVNQTINAVIETIEIQCWTNETEEECRRLMSAVILEMKRMRFNCTAFPNIQTDNKIAFGIARFRRVIGSGDTL